MKPVGLIGFSGHAYVVIDIFRSMGRQISGYCDAVEKANNPTDIPFFGSENEERGLAFLQKNDWFVAIGDNATRQKVFENLIEKGWPEAAVAIHSSAIISKNAGIYQAAMIGPRAVVNAFATIEKGAIINSGAIIEHECWVGKFAHIAPGAVLCGNVRIGEGSFIGAGSVVKQGVSIGKNVVVGAGSVILKDLQDGSKAFGNPARIRL